MKCSKGSEPLFEERWLQVRQKWSVLLNGIKKTIAQYDPEDKRRLETKVVEGSYKETRGSKEADRRRRSLRKVRSSGKRHPPKQSEEQKPRKEQCENHKHDKWWKKPYEVERYSLTEELIFSAIPQNCLTDEPIILEGMIEGHQVRRIHVDRGSSSKIMYEHCFKKFSANVRSRLRKCKSSLIGFSGEVYHPLGLVYLQ
ncbi:hypothetical protein Tco_0959017 [Tanacetum coccineum]